MNENQMPQTSEEQIFSITGVDEKKLAVSNGKSITVRRDTGIEAAKKILKVTTAAECAIAADAHRELRDVRKAVELAKKVIKGPIDALGKKIVALEKTFLEPSEKEERRLEGMINHFQRAQLEAQHAATALVVNETVQRTQTASEELGAARAELAALQAGSITEAVSARITDLELFIASREIEIDDLPAVEETAAIYTPEKVHGVSGKMVIDYELEGRNEYEKLRSLQAFAVAYPDLCTIELKRRDILEKLNKGDCFRSEFPEDQPRGENDLPHPPGLRLYRTVATRIR
jgi:hypothetical protein